MKRGMLSEYVKGGKRDREESLKTKSPVKVSEFGLWGEKGETSKGKRPYIAVITRGEHHANLPSKGRSRRKLPR